MILVFFIEINVFAHESLLEIYYDECIPVNYINSNDITDGDKKKTYIDCKTTFDEGGTGIVGPLSNLIRKTFNGSYVTSDNIIVLVESDLEAYYAGTLNFESSADTIEILHLFENGG